MNKNKISLFLITGVLVVVALVLFTSNGTNSGPRNPITGTLSEITGEVLAKLPSQDDFSKIFDAFEMVVNSQLQTGEDGRVRVTLSDNSIIRIGPNSDFTLLGEEEDELGFFTKLKLEAGDLFVILQGGSLQVDTPQGQASVRGSYLEVTINPDTGEITITCLEGECTAETVGGRVTMTAGQSATITSEDLPPGLGVMTEEDVKRWLEHNPEATVVILLLTATVESRENDESTPTETPTPTNTVTLTSTNTPTLTPANTPIPSNTPTPQLTLDKDVVCWTGPSTQYHVVGTIYEEQTVSIIGQTSIYWVVIHPVQGVQCWIQKGSGTATASAEDVPTAPIPPIPPTSTPITPTATNTPKLASITAKNSLTGGPLVGDSLTFNFTVNPAIAGGPPITGNVTVSGSSGSCTGAIVSGFGSCTINPINISGPITYTLSYPGNSFYAGSSDTTTVTYYYPTTTTVTVPTGLVFGENVTFNFGVTSTGGPTPTGTVTISGPGFGCSASVAVGSCTIASPGAGTGMAITATYSGDSVSYSSSGNGSLTITKASTSLSASGTIINMIEGDMETINFTLTITAGSGSPTGTISITSTNGGFCAGFFGPFTTPYVNSCQINFPTQGAYTITVLIPASANFTASTTSFNVTVVIP